MACVGTAHVIIYGGERRLCDNVHNVHTNRAGAQSRHTESSHSEQAWSTHL